MKKIFKLLILLLVVIFIIACGKDKKYTYKLTVSKNTKVSVTNKDYSNLISFNNIGEIHEIEGTLISSTSENIIKPTEKDIKVIEKCLNTVYDDISIADIVKYMDSQLKGHKVNIVYYTSLGIGNCDILWEVGNQTHIKLTIAFGIDGDTILPLEISEDFKYYIENTAPQDLLKKYHSLPKGELDYMMKHFVDDIVSKIYTPLLSANNGKFLTFTIYDLKEYMDNNIKLKFVSDRNTLTIYNSDDLKSF